MCPESELDARESYWIDYYNTYAGVGYNSAPGGEGASHPIKLSDSDIDGIIEKLKNTDIYLSDIAKAYNVSRKTISDINIGKTRIRDVDYPIRKNHFGIECMPSKTDILQHIEQCNGKFKDVATYYNVSLNCIIVWCKRLNIPWKQSDYTRVDKNRSIIMSDVGENVAESHNA